MASVGGLSETDDQSLLAAGNAGGFLRIFSFDGLSYTQVQEIDAGFVIKFIKITRERLVFAGGEGNICIYQKAGIEYTLIQSIRTD